VLWRFCVLSTLIYSQWRTNPTRQTLVLGHILRDSRNAQRLKYHHPEKANRIHCEKHKCQARMYRKRRCQEEAPRDQLVPERSKTCWHSWVWPGAGWSTDSPSSPDGAAQWCHYQTGPKVWEPALPPPVDKMSPILAPLADLEVRWSLGGEMENIWKKIIYQLPASSLSSILAK